ncbi:DUF3189 family protein [Inediibacterium massiliense]|uniref:DUF3189 family protein n=1 Tax=Inediibacterium massiliense TaxID=1658111 RepID=UPI0006B43CEE|nr:DUF3189 family protein [Inediibacterium massiliense]
MYIVYHDVGGAHSTIVAAAIHLNQLPLDYIPDKNELLALPLFDKIQKKDIARLIYHGKDEYGHSIYTIGRKNSAHLVVNAIETVFQMLNFPQNEILCVDTSPAVNNLMRIGGGSSRKFGLVSFGRPIVTYGTLKAYSNISEIVKKTKRKIVP